MKLSAFVFAALLGLLVWLQYKLWFSADGLSHFWQLKHSIAQLDQENAVLSAKNAAVAAEIRDLKQGDSAIEEHARHDLGLVKPGEVFYQIVR